jgi:hypothetical protein
VNCKKNRVQQIIEGMGNYVFRTPESEAIAKRRAEICAVCLQLKGEKTNWCPECHCYIPFAIRSMAKECDLKLW